MTYRIRYGSPIPQSAAQEIGEELEALTETRGPITATDVVEAASDPKSVLHQFFEWNDRAAAVKYREEQARGILRSVVVVVEDHGRTEEIRAFHSVVVDPYEPTKAEKRYISTAAAQRNPEWSQQIIVQARRELEAWRERYEGYRRIFSDSGRDIHEVLDFLDRKSVSICH